MKHLNKFSIVLIIFFSFGLTSNTNAGDLLKKLKQWRHQQPQPVKPSPVKPKKPIGAPLDAGILSILGAAGVGYYLMRRKNNKEK